ncbi:hypothetical protein NEMBOFW57_004561 [Staphylotrichum longicolle]|uniref:Transmembrane protein n=1 Tax=Staphylotrichum longicolle TaxID=669026 RepID=A0AAD4F9R1_9PEZI|nr:hypothetical protein NEMBOFW57_004561 [Staphylotrichum longicolle]
MFPTLARRLAQAAKPQLDAAFTNPGSAFKLKKVWPPDMKTMSPQQQLRFEKKYKRRLKIATARPRWDKFVRLAQLCTMTFVLTYVVLFMDWKDVPTPFDPVREKFWGFFGVFTEDSRKLTLKNKPSSSP